MCGAGILHVEYPHDAVEHVLIGVVGLAVIHVILLAMCSLVPCNEPVLLGEVVVCAVAPTPTTAAAIAAVVHSPLGAAEAAWQDANPSNINLIFMDVVC